MLDEGWPYWAANWLTDRYRELGMPASTWASRDCMFCSLRMNDTVTGVSGGVSPKTWVPGRSAGLMPEGTCVAVFGPGVEAEAGLAAASIADPAVSSSVTAQAIMAVRVGRGLIMIFFPSRRATLPANTVLRPTPLPGFAHAGLGFAAAKTASQLYYPGLTTKRATARPSQQDGSGPVTSLPLSAPC